MTMPNLMNCQHIPDGWCLHCVGEMYAEIESLRTKIEVSQNDSDIKRILGLDGTYLPCTIEDLIRNLFEQAKAWQALSFLVKKEHRNLPLIIQSNKLAREIEKSREEEQ